MTRVRLLQKYALEAEKKASNIIINVAVKPINTVLSSTGKITKRLLVFSPIKTLFINIIIGNIKPTEMGTKQNPIANTDFLILNFVGETLFNLLEVSLYFWLDLAFLSRTSKMIINTKVTIAIWDAADILFIPIHTLNIPRVSV